VAPVLSSLCICLTASNEPKRRISALSHNVWQNALPGYILLFTFHLTACHGRRVCAAAPITTCAGSRSTINKNLTYCGMKKTALAWRAPQHRGRYAGSRLSFVWHKCTLTISPAGSLTRCRLASYTKTALCALA